MWEIVGALAIFFIGLPILIGVIFAIPKWLWLVILFWIAICVVMVGAGVDSVNSSYRCNSTGIMDSTNHCSCPPNTTYEIGKGCVNPADF